MSPTKGTFGNALAHTQASSGMIAGAISKSNSAEGQATAFAKTQGAMAVPGTSSTSGVPVTRQSGGASPFRDALKRGVVSGVGMLTF